MFLYPHLDVKEGEFHIIVEAEKEVEREGLENVVENPVARKIRE